MLSKLVSLIDVMTYIQKVIKYLIEGCIIALIVFIIKHPSFDNLLIIGTGAAAIFSILDTYMPSMGSIARTGAGFGIGASMVGFPLIP